jgi:predicted PurR-regulated permease PerM
VINDANKIQQSTALKIIILSGLILLAVLYLPEIINISVNIYGIVYPLLLGAAMAYVLNIIMSGYEKIYFPQSKNQKIIGSRRGVCIVLAILTIMLVLLFFLWAVMPQIARTIYLLTAGFPDMYNNVVAWIQQYADQVPGLKQKLEEFDMDGAAVLKRSLGTLGSWAFGTVSLVGLIFGKIVSFVVALVFGIYVLFAREELKVNIDKVLKAYMGADKRGRLYEDMRLTDETFSSYITGQCKEAVILGVLCTIGMLLFGFPYAITIGPVIGLTALVPMVGAYIGAAVGFFLIVMVAPVKALMFLVFIVVLQQLEGNLIYPKVVGESIGLPGIWVLAAITVGGGLMGIAGVILGVPVAATVYKLLGKAVNEKLDLPSA